MISAEPNRTLTPSDIVHHAAYEPKGFTGFTLLCDAPWVVVDSTYHVRVLTEVDPIGRMVTASPTKDPVDCMSCLVVQARR